MSKKLAIVCLIVGLILANISLETEAYQEKKYDSFGEEKDGLVLGNGKKNIETEWKIIPFLMETGFAPDSGRKIDTIVIHSSYDAFGEDPFSVEGIVKEFEMYGVAAHYLIGRQGDVYQLVEDKNIAYHAGVSQVPDGRRNVNDFSLGIELVNTKDGNYTQEQYASLNKLLELIKGNHEIKYVLGHKDIAPERKDDPWNFEWQNIH